MLDVKARGRDVRRFVCATGALGDRHPGRVQREGRNPRGPRRRLGQRPDRRRAPTARPPRTRSPPSASSCAAGSAFTASRSTSSRTCSHFDGIVPCGIRDHGVTSLVDLGLPVTMADLDAALMRNLPAPFPGRLAAAARMMPRNARLLLHISCPLPHVLQREGACRRTGHMRTP